MRMGLATTVVAAVTTTTALLLQAMVVQGRTAHVVATCELLEESPCPDVPFDLTATYYIPQTFVSETGEETPFGMDGLMGLMVGAQAQVESFRSFLAVPEACNEATRRVSCTSTFLKCESAADIPIPRLLCTDVCMENWVHCGSVYEYAISVLPYLADIIPSCGQVGAWTKYKVWPQNPSSPKAGELFGDIYGGLNVYASAAVQDVTVSGAQYSVTCTSTAEIDAGETGSGGGGSGSNRTITGHGGACAVVDCPPPLIRSTELDQNGCATSCDVACPLPAFEGDMSFLAKAEVAPAIAAIPPLLYLWWATARVTWKGARAGGSRISSAQSPATTSSQTRSALRRASDGTVYLQIASIAGMVHSTLVVALVSASQTGCNAAGVFTSHLPDFWLEDSQATVCTVMRLSSHLPQVLLNAVACFVLVTYFNFMKVVAYQPFPKRAMDITGVVLVLLVPGVCAAMTAVHGCQQSVEFFDGFHVYSAVRSLYRCIPEFHNSNLYFAVVELPMVLAVLIIVGACAKIILASRKVVKAATHHAKHSQLHAHASKADTASAMNQGYIVKTARLGHQFLVFAIGAAALFTSKLVAATLLETKLQEYTEALDTFIVCSFLGELGWPDENGCAGVQDLSADSRRQLIASLASSSLIAPFFAYFFAALHVFNKRGKERKYAQTKSAVAPAAQSASAESTTSTSSEDK